MSLRVTRVVRALRGSSWPVLVETDAGPLVVKLRGAAQGMLPLVAELVVGSLADALGLATPARHWAVLDADVPSDDPHEELRFLLERSVGLNLGFQHLDGYRDATPADAARIDRKLAASIVWLDGLCENPDRTRSNPNLMLKAGQVQLIDHGAALAFQHDWRHVSEQTPREPGPFVGNHLLQVTPAELAGADELLSPRLTRFRLDEALEEVPDELWAAHGAKDPARERATYVAYLWKRLHAPRPFVSGGKHVPFQFGR